MCCCNNNGSNIQDDFLVYAIQFTSPTEYANVFLKDRRFRIHMRGLGFLVRGVEWDYLPNGGFKILIPGWVAGSELLIFGQFY